MANLTISLDENIVKQARIKAIQEGTSLSAKVREFLVAYVQGEAKPQTLAQRVVLPVSSSKGGFLPGALPEFVPGMDS